MFTFSQREKKPTVSLDILTKKMSEVSMIELMNIMAVYMDRKFDERMSATEEPPMKKLLL